MFTKTPVNSTWALSKIGNLLSGMSTKASQELGIEFELEGTQLGPEGLVTQKLCKDIEGYGQAQANGKWNWHYDGTLLKGMSGEFVLAKPLPRNEAKAAVEELFEQIKQNAVLTDSHRTSTHVHMNFQHMNVNQVFLFLTLYYIFEECYFKAFAPERWGNQFCLSASQAGGIIENHIKNLQSGKFYKGMQTSEKYAAMNFASLSYHGTLEARLMGGCKDPQVFFKWLDVLLELYDYSKNNPKLTPEYFLGQFSGIAFMLFTMKELPKTYAVVKDLPDVGKMVSEGVFIAQDMAMAVDWTPVIEATEPEVVKKVQLSSYIEAGHPQVWHEELLPGSIPPSSIQFNPPYYSIDPSLENEDADTSW